MVSNAETSKVVFELRKLIEKSWAEKVELELTTAINCEVNQPDVVKGLWDQLWGELAVQHSAGSWIGSFNVILEPVCWGQAVDKIECFDFCLFNRQFRSCSRDLSWPSGLGFWLCKGTETTDRVLALFREEYAYFRTPSDCSHKVALRLRAFLATLLGWRGYLLDRKTCCAQRHWS